MAAIRFLEAKGNLRITCRKIKVDSDPSEAPQILYGLIDGKKQKMKEDTTVKDSGIYIITAFKMINKCHLLVIVKTTADEDENRLIHFLRSGTVINTRIKGT